MTPSKLTCATCDAPYGEDGWVDVIIPDGIWKRVIGNEHGGGVMCFRCMTKRLEELGFGPTNQVAGWLESGPWKGSAESTVDLVRRLEDRLSDQFLKDQEASDAE